MLLRALAILACVGCAGGVPGQAMADVLPFAANIVASDGADLPMLAPDEQQPGAERGDQPTSSSDSTSEEDDHNDAADADPVAITGPTTRIVQLPPLRRELPTQDSLVPSVHRSLDPRPPRA